VATNLSNSITQHLKVKYGKEKAKEITTRSSRKGCMTESRSNCELDRSHEYARNGHTDCNPVSVCVILYCVILVFIHCLILHAISNPQNAEGYVQTTPAMSAPGGRALAGYPDPHAHCSLRTPSAWQVWVV
jgi:hypothetical protein